MNRTLALVAPLAIIISARSFAQQPCSRQAIEDGLERILRMPNLGELYVEDASCDGSIVKQPPDYHFTRSEVAPILQCVEKAAPILIEHLDDVRLTTALFKGGAHWDHPVRVPLGVVCLDLLLSISTFDSPVRDATTENDDMLGAGILPSFYFRPDSYRIRGGRYVPTAAAVKVKANWKNALASGHLKFEYSAWHRGEF